MRISFDPKGSNYVIVIPANALRTAPRAADPARNVKAGKYHSAASTGGFVQALDETTGEQLAVNLYVGSLKAQSPVKAATLAAAPKPPTPPAAK